ncbi:Agmatine deiminase [Pandoraea terrae]|uniref:Agmatine deiminase n=1 Tax=Pandoraea terrae TaxID=1537710 RepID=A0A5E4TBJ2_9BURK|nr:agmatine deiminase family protein [Pandoraea terrae]VVD85500.1 Agmatine deiminase [Pandoraea terrae]
MTRAFPAAGATRWRMPAEWTPHAGCWMGWPCPSAIPDAVERDAVLTAFAAIAYAIAAYEPLHVVAASEYMQDARAALPASATLHALPLDDLWLRDTGPTFLVDGHGGSLALSWNFNNWGEKPMSCSGADRPLAHRLAVEAGVAVRHAPIVAEGGSLHVDGDGTLLVTETSILNENRNPGLTHQEAEAVFRHWLGVEKVVWLPGSWIDTITDGHIDGIACFVKPGVLLASGETDDGSAIGREAAKEARENLRALQLARDARGRGFEIATLNGPEMLPGDAAENDDFSAEYVNFYMANGGIVMPAFGDAKADAAARETISRAFPDRTVTQIRIDAIARRGGGIHCCTQQQPVVCGEAVHADD